ncbi:MAG: MBL fold metallo-hydrolase [Dehalococcoidia bacterium]
MILKVVVVGPYMENTYIVGCEKSGEAALVDAGAEGEAILKAVGDSGLKVKIMINTHGHEDHVGAVAVIKEATDALFAIHDRDVPIMHKPPGSASMIPDFRDPPDPDICLKEGDTIEIGELRFKVLETHGHTPGGVSFLGHGVVFTGDTLFRGSVGRTDFEGGNWEQLINSIRTKLLTLPDETVVLPGHGPDSTIGAERQWNPFLKEGAV